MMNQTRSVVLLIVILLSMSMSAGAQDMTGTVQLRFESGISNTLSPNLKLPNVVSSELGNTLYFGAGAAYQLSERIRTDLAFTYRGGLEQVADLGNEIHAKGDFQSTAIMANVTYEFSQFGAVIPYVSGGLGLVINHVDQISVTSSDDRPLATINGGGWSNFGAQIGGGVTIPVRDNLFLDLGYRYFDGGKYESDDLVRTASGVNLTFSRHVGDLTANEFVVGLRIRIY